MNKTTSLILWVVFIGGVFAFLWYKGYLQRLANYAAETKEELRKCTWPTKQELGGSTVVVVITLIMLAIFTVSVDFVFSTLMGWITAG